MTSVNSLLSAPARGWLGPLSPAPPHSPLPPCSRVSETAWAQAEWPGCTWQPVPRRLPAQPSRLTSAHPPRRFASLYSHPGSVRTAPEGGGTKQWLPGPAPGPGLHPSLHSWIQEPPLFTAGRGQPGRARAPPRVTHQATEQSGQCEDYGIESWHCRSRP